MKVVPASGPVITAPTTNSASQASARDRAIAVLKGTTAQLNAVPSQTPAAQFPPSKRPPMSVAGHSVADETPIQAAATEVDEITQEESSVQQSTNDVEAQEASTEPAATPVPVEEAPQISSQYAQLARQQKAFRTAQVAAKAQEAQLKQREEALKAREAEMLSKYIPKDSFVKDPIKVLQEQGFSPEQIANMMLNQPDPAEQQRQSVLDKLEAKIKALEDGQESSKKNDEDNKRAQYTQAVNLIRKDTAQLVDTDPNFETIKATDSVEDVVELITKTFEQEGHIMAVEEAAQLVEDHLVEEVERLAKLKKMQSRLKAAPPATTAAATQAPSGASKTATKTLTSAMNNSRPLTAKERAVLAFKGELKD